MRNVKEIILLDSNFEPSAVTAKDLFEGNTDIQLETLWCDSETLLTKCWASLSNSRTLIELQDFRGFRNPHQLPPERIVDQPGVEVPRDVCSLCHETTDLVAYYPPVHTRPTERAAINPQEDLDVAGAFRPALRAPAELLHKRRRGGAVRREHHRSQAKDKPSRGAVATHSVPKPYRTGAELPEDQGSHTGEFGHRSWEGHQYTYIEI